MPDIVTVTMNPAIDISASVERVAPIRKMRCANVRRDPGGGGINAARVARRLGAEVTAIYPAGGAIGQLLHRLVDEEGLASVALPIREETREDFTALEEASGIQYRFVLPGPRLTEGEWQKALEALSALDRPPRYVVASGSLPPGVPDDFYARLSERAKALGAKIAVDTSGPALRAALDEGVSLAKPNLRELRELTGTSLTDEASRIEACRSLARGGKAEFIALTLGADGALLVNRERGWRARGLPIKPKSTVGAGDSFLGAMVWSLASGHSAEDAFRYGIAAGSAALLSPGTELARREDVERLIGQVEVTEVG